MEQAIVLRGGTVESSDQVFRGRLIVQHLDDRQRCARMRRGGEASWIAMTVAMIVGAVGSLVSIPKAELAATIDLGIETLDDRQFGMDDLAARVSPGPGLDAESDRSLSLTNGPATQLDLERSPEPIVTSRRLSDSTRDSLVLVLLPARFWSGLEWAGHGLGA